jgi:hypothetical protein
VLNSDPAAGGPPTGAFHEANLWTTAILLVRQAGERTRIVYDLQPWLRDAPPEPPPRPPDGRWERATGGKSKGAGATLQERAERGGSATSRRVMWVSRGWMWRCRRSRHPCSWPGM